MHLHLVLICSTCALRWKPEHPAQCGVHFRFSALLFVRTLRDQFSPKMWTKHLDGATLGDSVRSRGNVVSPALRARRWTWHSNPQRWEWWLGNIWKHWESWLSCVSEIRFAVSVAERRCFPAWSTIRTIWRWRQSNGRSWDMVPGCTMPRLKRLDHFKESCDKAFVWTSSIEMFTSLFTVLTLISWVQYKNHSIESPFNWHSRLTCPAHCPAHTSLQLADSVQREAHMLGDHWRGG